MTQQTAAELLVALDGLEKKARARIEKYMRGQLKTDPAKKEVVNLFGASAKASREALKDILELREEWMKQMVAPVREVQDVPN